MPNKPFLPRARRWAVWLFIAPLFIGAIAAVIAGIVGADELIGPIGSLVGRIAGVAGMVLIVLLILSGLARLGSGPAPDAKPRPTDEPPRPAI